MGTPYSLLPTPYSLLLTPYSLLLTPYSLYPYPFIPIPLSLSLYPYPFIPIPLYQAFPHDVTVPRICPGSDQIFAKHQGLDPGHDLLVTPRSPHSTLPRISTLHSPQGLHTPLSP